MRQNKLKDFCGGTLPVILITTIFAALAISMAAYSIIILKRCFYFADANFYNLPCGNDWILFLFEPTEK